MDLKKMIEELDAKSGYMHGEKVVFFSDIIAVLGAKEVVKHDKIESWN